MGAADRLMVAVVGSRQYPEPQRVLSFVRRLAEKYPQVTVVSGGAWHRSRQSVDWLAEQEALRLGLAVVSFRVEQALPEDLGPRPFLRLSKLNREEPFTEADLEAFEGYRAAWRAYTARIEALRDVYLVAVYEFDRHGGMKRTVLSERYRSFGSAAYGRNTMIVSVVSEVAAFHDGTSRGTAHSMSEAERLGKPLHLNP